MPVGAGEDLNYMGGMRTVEAMMHAAEVSNVHGSSVGSAVRQNSSFNASSAKITNMTKTSWTDFQKYAFVVLCAGDHIWNNYAAPVFRINDRSTTINCARMSTSVATASCDLLVCASGSSY